MLFGMNFYEALCHSFSTLGTGGFSTRNESVKAFNSAGIDIVITIFMFLAGINFSLYYHLFKGKFREIKENSELKLSFSFAPKVEKKLKNDYIKQIYNSIITTIKKIDRKEKVYL